MLPRIEKPLINLSTPDPSPQLLSNIMTSIMVAKQRVLKRRVFLFLGGSVLASILTTVAIVYLKDDLGQSGFTQFASLILTDPAVVFSAWSDFTQLLLESLPSLSLATLIIATACFFINLKMFAKNVLDLANSRRHQPI